MKLVITIDYDNFDSEGGSPEDHLRLHFFGKNAFLSGRQRFMHLVAGDSLSIQDAYGKYVGSAHLTTELDPADICYPYLPLNARALISDSGTSDPYQNARERGASDQEISKLEDEIRRVYYAGIEAYRLKTSTASLIKEGEKNGVPETD
jgi:hypothetical protein